MLRYICQINLFIVSLSGNLFFETFLIVFFVWSLSSRSNLILVVNALSSDPSLTNCPSNPHSIVSSAKPGVNTGQSILWLSFPVLQILLISNKFWWSPEHLKSAACHGVIVWPLVGVVGRDPRSIICFSSLWTFKPFKLKTDPDAPIILEVSGHWCSPILPLHYICLWQWKCLTTAIRMFL